jgi:hypothetical protein
MSKRNRDKNTNNHMQKTRQKTKYWATQTQLKSGVESGASEGYVVPAPPIQIISRNEEHRIFIRIAQIIGTLLWFSSLNYRITKLSENENSVLVWNIQWVHTFLLNIYIIFSINLVS